ncbi:MAG: class I SAM-dependent methyltransferase [Desulfobaccales bacterium]
MRTTIKKHGKALEVGPGSGIYLPILLDHYDHVVAIDIEESYLKYSEPLTVKNPNLVLLVDDISRSTLPEMTFDLILCSEVIEHIADSASAISEMHRLLKPGGILILSTPQKLSFLEIMARVAFMPGIIDLVKMVYKESIIETGHINLLSDREVFQQLRQAGFRICETFKSGLYLPLIAEFLGMTGLRWEKWIEGKLRGKSLDFILWVQYYIAEA